MKSIHKFFTPTIVLIIIVFFASIFRLWALGQIPAGVHEDELAYGYNAYALLQTGKDEHGVAMPLVLESFGEYKPALYAYFTIPWIALFDLTPFSVRITTALFGIFSVVMLYFLTKKLFNNAKIALIASGILALSPWHITLSRTTSEVVVSVFFLLLLVYAAKVLQERFSIIWLLIACMSGIFAMESYTASRFFVIILTGLTFLFSIKRAERKFVFSKVLLLLCIGFIFVGIGLSRLDSASRFNQISIFSTPETKLVLEEQLREDMATKPIVTRAFHNKLVNYVRTFSNNYSEYFTFDYLFLNGGLPTRLIIPNSGLFYLWQLPFMLIGIYMLIRKKEGNCLFLFLWWLVLLFPAALTYDEIPNIYRSLIILPPLVMVTAIGIYTSLVYLSKKKYFFSIPFVLIIVLIAGWELAYFQHQSYVHQEEHHPWYRGYALKEMADTVGALAPEYKKVVITRGHSGAYISLLFYQKYDPALYQQVGSPGNGGFGKYEFVPVDCSLNAGAKGLGKIYGEVGVLYVDRGDCKRPKKNAKLIKTIYWQDDTPAYHLYEYIPSKTKKL